MKSLLLFLSLLLACFNCLAQTDISLKWQKTYGGSMCESPKSIQQTSDGGYIMAGCSESNDGDVTGNHGSYDYWVVKINSSGLIQWQKSYGGSANDDAYTVQQTTDGGYIIGGGTESYDGDITVNHGGQDIWIVKTDPLGDIQWQKSYGGSSWDYVRGIKETPDGGYIFTGSVGSVDGDVTGNHGIYDFWVVKISSSGLIQWQKCYGGSLMDTGSDIQLTTDGGYLIVGSSESDDGDVSGNHGMMDNWVVKIDQSGTIQWQKSYGGSGEDIDWGGQLTLDGGYILAGSSQSTDGDVTGNHGGNDYWVVKIDQAGTIQWQKSYGGSDEDIAWGVQQLTEGGYIIAGSSASNNGDVTGNHGYFDYWVIQTDPSGIIQWQKSLGGTDSDEAYSVLQTISGNYIVTGYTWSDDGDVTGYHGCNDYWTAVLCNNDPLSISISDTSYCYSTILIATPGFAKYLWSNGDTTQTTEVTSGGNYSVSGINSTGCPSVSQIIVPGPFQPYGGEEICMVTLDSLTGKNVLVIEKTPNVGTDSVLIYRMDNLSSLYKLIGTIGINDPGIYTDAEAIPAQQSYQYKISVKDTCGKESELSGMHCTILLQANTGINHEVNLFWNPYEGFEYPNFEIYRSTSINEFSLIANVPNTTFAYTDLNPPSGSNLYQVRVSKESPCVPMRSNYIDVRSNIITSSNIGLDETRVNPYTVYPNPASDLLTVKVSFQGLGSLYSITDQAGQTLLKGTITSEVSAIDISGLSSGMYTLILGDVDKVTFKILKK